jgi:hypothetical protein
MHSCGTGTKISTYSDILRCIRAEYARANTKKIFQLFQRWKFNYKRGGIRTEPLRSLLKIQNLNLKVARAEINLLPFYLSTQIFHEVNACMY